MSPVEKAKQFTESTRISLPVTVLLTLLGTAGGAVAAGYAAKDQILNKVATERAAALVVERAQSDRLYMSKDEFWQTIYPKLVRIEAAVNEIKARQR